MPPGTPAMGSGLQTKGYERVILSEFLSLICSWWFGFQCFFGAAGCDAESAIPGAIYILLHAFNHVGAANLLRHAEGATWLAVVMVTKPEWEIIMSHYK